MIKRMIILVMLMSMSLVACKIPGFTPPTPFVFPTPDLTLTAVYAVLITPTQAPPTQTPPPVQTETPEPSPTVLAVHTNTAEVSSTPVEPEMSPVPTNTKSPFQRPGASIVATYLAKAPVLDGDLGDWDLVSYAVTAVVFGKDSWDSAADLSGSVMAGWDDNYLYLGTHVVDENYVQNATGDDLYQGDSLEVMLDTNLAADFYVEDLSPDDFQLGISPGRSQPGVSPEAFLWFPRSITGARSQVIIAAKEAADGYIVEVAIPWNVFEVSPKPGAQYGFAFSVSDNDQTGQILQQTMISNVSTRRLLNPTTWGNLTLYKP